MIVNLQAHCAPSISQDYAVRMEGPDKGLINAWVTGLDKRSSSPDLALKAEAGELPLLPFKGGVEAAIKTKSKIGHLLYVAMWQGLRGDDLDIDTDAELSMTCSRTGVPVLYTMDFEKLRNAV
ncbi:hypothetical protein GmRootA79_16350 [Acidovorax sp. A79]|uniref:hypothetical protein n=1 Tax=Acidovorax sp. A79 TaxID=3056107 RepID=UPI0034E8870B